MKLESEDFPLIAQGNLIYTQRKADGQVLVAIDEAMAQDVVDRLNREADRVQIPRLEIGRPVD